VVSLTTVSGEQLSTFASSMATASSRLTEVVEQPEWGPIAARLNTLSSTAPFGAIRPYRNNIAIILGRDRPAVDRAQSKEYAEFLAVALADIAEAARTLAVGQSAIDAAKTLAATAGQPELAAAGSLVAGLLTLRGSFLCASVDAVPSATDEEVDAWRRDGSLYSWRPPFAIPVAAAVLPWMWDGTRDLVVGPPQGAGLPLTPADLTRNLKFVNQASRPVTRKTEQIR
jgi:hypothetical protein